MKKFIILMAALLSLSFSVTASAAPENVDFEDKAAVLANFEIIENAAENADYKITRRDFVISVGKMLGINIYKMDENRYYRDMTSDDRAWNVANALVTRGILTVGEDRLFRPDDIITSHEAACIVMKVLGVRNVDYSMYFNMAVSCDVLDGVTASELSYKDAVEILYNTLNTNTFNYSGTEGFKQGETTLMENLFDLQYIEGYVTAVNNTSLYENAGFGLNTIVIEDTAIDCDLVDAYSYLGCYVSAYYTDIDDTYTLVNIFVRENKTDKITVSADDFAGFDKTSYTAEYYVSGNKTKKLDIEKGATVIKNGDNDTSDITGAFGSLKNGEISFIDADNNNSYEVVIINSYENIVVRHIDKEDSIIYGKYGNIVDLSDENIPVLIVSVTGEEKTINDIAANNVISYYESDNLKKLVVSDNTVNGDITALTEDNDYTRVTISGTEYKIDKNYIENSVITLNAGSTVKALVDAYGKIADIEVTKNTGAIYAWLVNSFVDTDTDDRLKLRLFTENSELELVNLAKKVNIDGVQYSENDKIIKALENANGEADGQLVMIKKNADGEISYIDTVYAGNEKSGLFVSAEEETQTFFGGQMLLGPKIRLNSSSKLFIVPQNSSLKNDEEAYSVVNGNKFFVSWKTYAVTGYRNGLSDTVGYVEAMVLKRDLTGTSTKSYTGNILVVKDIKNVWDEEESSVKKEVVLLNGKSDATYICSADYDVLADTNVKVGNIIQVATNPKGEMVGSTLVYGEGKKDTFAFAVWTNENERACGYIYDLRDGIVGLSLAEGEVPFTCLVTTDIPVMVYDPSLKDSVYTGNEGDLIEAQALGYKVVVDMARGATKSFTVVKAK